MANRNTTSRMSRAEFYRMVSGAIRQAHESSPTIAERKGVARLAHELEKMFINHNVKFDAERFRRDSGVD